MRGTIVKWHCQSLQDYDDNFHGCRYGVVELLLRESMVTTMAQMFSMDYPPTTNFSRLARDARNSECM